MGGSLEAFNLYKSLERKVDGLPPQSNTPPTRLSMQAPTLGGTGNFKGQGHVLGAEPVTETLGDTGVRVVVAKLGEAEKGESQ